MPIREDLVASAAKFLQDPNVASSPIENQTAFLQAKNLTPEEVDAALARAGARPRPPESYSHPSLPPASPAYPAAPQAQSYYGQYPPQQYPPPHAWQAAPPDVPRRDWRDWFIMATVVGGVGYGIYALGKRYVYPLVAPPTPERLEQDKKMIDEQFDKAFGLVEQLAKDTEALKAAEQERTERLDAALAALESVMADLKSANRRREDDAQRVRDDVQGLKNAIPQAMSAQKDVTDRRLKEVNAELKSLKTLITQRMNAGSNSNLNGGGYASRLTNGDAAAATPVVPSSSPGDTAYVESEARATAAADGSKRPDLPSAISEPQRASPFSSMLPSKASIPAWQLAMASKGASSSSTTNGADAVNDSSAQGSPSAS